MPKSKGTNSEKGKPRERQYVPSKTQLASRIGVSRPTLDILFALPDHPRNHSEGESKFDVEDWTKFAAKHNYGKDRPALSEKDASIIARNRVRIAREEFTLQKELGEYLPRRDVNTHIDTANAIVARELRKAFCQELPPRQEGMSAAEIKKMNEKRLDEICRQLPKHLKNSRGED